MDDPQWTRRDPGVTSRDGAGPEAGAPGEGLIRLPGVLAGRFRAEGELPVQGAESDLLLVRDVGDADGRYVVKIYRRGYRADPAVWEQVPRLRSRHVVRVLETGHADGRDYEIMEYLPEGNLRRLTRAARVDPTAVVAQLADGLKALHDAGIVHRDLKPENVLVRGADLVITDFGLSRVLEQSVVFASSSRTLAYAAPESLSGQVSPARDWWSLGMIARELVTGRAPFDGMSETVVVDHLATRPIDNTDVDDPHLRLLCRGLLTRDPRHRWGYPEVTAWLRGETPPVHAEAAAPVVRVPEARPPEPQRVAPSPELKAAEDAYRAEGRRALWEQKESARKAGAGRARVRAVLWSLPFLALWTAGSVAVEALFGGEPDRVRAVNEVQKMPVPLGLLLTAAVAAWLVSCAVEVALASRQGSDYLVEGPWATLAKAARLTGGGLSKTSRAMSATAQRTGARGCGLALLAATIPLLLLLLLLSALSALAWMLWLLAIAVGTVAHAVGGGLRAHRWRTANSARRAEVIGD
ncbi:serine/threonine protein kinase [Actinocorallia sp. API 0066]|uniref:serine/threonine-protein kinase n=1 Tax=Actinocorallia sp. API 0066 TaxID=2896846 RepID=UPI001E2DCB3F|nr:serine/threonine-protein kinase [Actinocorallia sp. API 0066]MCD0447929.1 serine/threonine protein kinase [Actinocorallia sp. API 0066]